MNLWNRNAVVREPTNVGNLVGGVLAIPVAALVFVIEIPVNVFYRHEPWFLYPILGGAYAVGGLFGAPFIPISLLFDDDPDGAFCNAPM